MALLGRLLRPLRAGAAGLLVRDPRLASSGTLAVSSDAFAADGPLPASSVGPHGAFPAIRWSRPPAGTREILVVVEDADVPFRAPLVHAVVYGLRSQAAALDAGDVPSFAVPGAARRDGLRLGRSAGVGTGFLPITPLPGHGPHRYAFEVFALDASLDGLPPRPTLRRLRAAIAGRVLASGVLIGTAEA